MVAIGFEELAPCAEGEEGSEADEEPEGELEVVDDGGRWGWRR